MIFDKLNIREIRVPDVEVLERWRRMYYEGTLEIPFGYTAPGVETSIAESSGEMITALTAKQAMIFDPLIHRPDIKNGAELITAIIMLERTLAYAGQKAGAVEGYISIPSELTDYHKIVQKAGYQEVGQGCKVFRRAFRPHTVPSLGSERAKVVELMNTAEVSKLE